MTNEKAIKILNTMPISASSDLTFEEISEAINHAVSCMRSEERIKKSIMVILQYLTENDVEKLFKDKPYRLKTTINKFYTKEDYEYNKKKHTWKRK